MLERSRKNVPVSATCGCGGFPLLLLRAGGWSLGLCEGSGCGFWLFLAADARTRGIGL